MNQLTNNPEKSWPKVMADFSEGTENQANVLELIRNGVQYDLWVASAAQNNRISLCIVLLK